MNETQIWQLFLYTEAESEIGNTHRICVVDQTERIPHKFNIFFFW